MSIETLKNALPAFAKDTRINLGNILTEEGAPGLSQEQIFGVALSLAFSLKNKLLITELKKVASFSPQNLEGIKVAVSLMGMNNIYYRTVHLSENSNLSTLPARLRMTGMVQHGIDKKDFEIYSLAISTLTGCGMCIKSHTQKLLGEGLSIEGVQSTIRIASVIKAFDQTFELDSL